MQFHLNGFQPGDPEIADPAERRPAPGAAGPVPEEVDVLIVGCGPAGLTLAAQLAAFPDIKTCIVEQKAGPLLRGQADGVACRTMETFEAFGFSERLMKEACWINESRFWRPDDKKSEKREHGLLPSQVVVLLFAATSRDRAVQRCCLFRELDLAPSRR